MGYIERMIKAAEQAKITALENKDANSAGRYDGLKQALEILQAGANK